MSNKGRVKVGNIILEDNKIEAKTRIDDKRVPKPK